MAKKKKKNAAVPAATKMVEATDIMPCMTSPGRETACLVGLQGECQQSGDSGIASGTDEHTGKQPEGVTGMPVLATQSEEGKGELERALIFLRFDAPYILFKRVNDILEKACFAYGKASMPEVLKRQGLECAEMVHLSMWADMLSEWRVDMNSTIGELNYKGEYSSIPQAMRDIRAVLVERTPIDTAGIQRLLLSSCWIVAMLRRTEYTGIVASLVSHVDGRLRRLRRDVRVVHSRAGPKLKQIQEERAELDRQEKRIQEERAELDRQEERIRKELDDDIQQVHNRTADSIIADLP